MTENKKIRILIVDDDEMVRGNYVDVFKKNNFEVEEAVDGLDGLDRAIKNIPDIIFTGIIMPKMDGFGLKDALSKNVATANIPVVMSSHMGREEDRQKAKKSGIKDFIVLGLDRPNDVVKRIMVLLGPSAKKGYSIKINSTELSAPELAKDMLINEKFQCQKCGSDLTLSLTPSNVNKGEFLARIVCPKCK